MNTVRAALLIGSLGLALIGQYLFLVVKEIPGDGLFLFVLAIVLFCLLAWQQEGAAAAEGPSFWPRIVGWIAREPVRAMLVGLSFLLAYLTLRMIGGKTGNDTYWDAFFVWALTGAVYALAFLKLPPRLDLRAWISARRGDLAWMLGLTMAGGFLRFVALGQIPNILSGDEGVIGNLALSAARGDLNDMFASVFGHSTLYVMLMGASVDLFGNTAFGLRLPNAIAGTVTIPALYVLARRMFDRRVAILAATLLVFSHIHVHFSRIIVAGSVMDALFAVLVFWLLYEGLVRKSAFFFALSGLAVGLHLYVYMGGRLLVLLLPVYFVALILLQWPKANEHLPRMAALAGAIVVSGLPMARWALEHPEEFGARANQVGVIQSGWLANEAAATGVPAWQILGRLLLDAFLTVSHYPAEAFYRSSYPMLDFAAGAFFFLGLGYSLLRIRDARFLMLNGWFWSGIVVGGALVVLPSLAAYRVLIVLPAAILFASVGVNKTIEMAERVLALTPRWPAVAMVCFLLVSAAINVKAYWVDWAPKCAYEDPATRFASQMGSYLATQPSKSQVFLMGEPFIHYGIHQSIDFLDGKMPVQDILEPLVAPPALSVDPGRPIIFVATPQREPELQFVVQAWPNGTRLLIRDCDHVSMIIYEVGPNGSGR